MTNTKHLFCGGALTALLLCGGAATYACTTFTVHSTVSETGRMLLHKCRDRERFGRLDANIRVSPDGIRWMQIGHDGRATFAMNDRGVAITSNTGNKMTGRGVPKIPDAQFWPFQRVMEDYDSAEAAIPVVERIHRNPAGIFMIVDPRRAFVVEAGAGYGVHSEVTHGLQVFANEMHLPGIEKVTATTGGRLVKQRTREANTRAALRETRDENGKYTRRGMFAASRNICGSTPETQNVFRKISITAVCFELDGEFPAQLGTAYIALGPQRHTVYLPCPMALEQFPEKFRDGSWADLAMTLRKRQGDANPLLPRIVALEDELLAEYDRTREEARQLLRDGKTDEAKKILNDLFRKQYAKAETLMAELTAAPPATPAASKKGSAPR